MKINSREYGYSENEVRIVTVNCTIEKGDTIHTENSHKFDSDRILEVVENSGLQIKNSFTDSNNWFALIEFEKE